MGDPLWVGRPTVCLTSEAVLWINNLTPYINL